MAFAAIVLVPSVKCTTFVTLPRAVTCAVTRSGALPLRLPLNRPTGLAVATIALIEQAHRATLSTLPQSCRIGVGAAAVVAVVACTHSVAAFGRVIGHRPTIDNACTAHIGALRGQSITPSFCGTGSASDASRGPYMYM